MSRLLPLPGRPLRRPAALALLLAALLAAPAWAQYRIPAGYSSEVIQVRLEEGRSPSEIDAVVPPALRSQAARIRPLFTVDPRRLVELREEGRRRTGRSPVDLRLWFEVQLRPGTDAAAFVVALRGAPGVAVVEPAPLPAPPPSMPLAPPVAPLVAPPPGPPSATTPSFVADQGYLDPATDGIDAEFAWTVPGGNGAGVTVYDVEYSWNQDHEDLSAAAGVALLLPAGHTQRDPFSDDNHGTAVLGELIADNDAIGVTGISWGAGIGLAPAATFDAGNNPVYNPANAIALAAADGGAGDVILIEQQTAVCGLPDPCTGGNCGPSEWVQSVFDAIVNATAAGRVVVEAAGNGGVDLDQDSCNGLFDRSNRDSGAIIVGQGWAPGPTDRERRPNSSYGSRVDLQGWGNSVTTTGYGASYVDPDDPTNPDRWYTDAFNGTSSASPMVAGAVANLQGIRAAAGQPLFSAAEVRQLLVDTGSPQQGDLSEHIGPRPDLLMAIASFMNVPPVADAGPDQTVECASPAGTPVTLDASGSTDANGDAHTYTWRENGNQIATGASPTVAFALGTHTVELTVDDGNGGADTDTVVITVEDTTDPVVTLIGPSELTLECHVDEYVEQGATAEDLCEGDLPVTISGTVDTHTPGVYVLTYTATDGSGNEGAATRTVTVVDTTPPEIVVNNSPLTVWPPNHHYHTFSLADLGVEASDLCDLNLSADDVVIASVTSDEEEDVRGPGDGSTLDDIVIDPACQSADLRAERLRPGNGRVYTLFLEAVDASGNVGTATAEVHVPPSNSGGGLAVLDLPALYTVEGCEPVPPARVAAARGTPGAATAPTAAQAAALPTEYRLGQNYPNPFDGTTRIPFALPEAGETRLALYDLLGREVAVLFAGALPAGVHEVAFDAAGLPRGVYLYRLAVADRVLTGRMLHR